jgi:hypothetical protein
MRWVIPASAVLVLAAFLRFAALDQYPAPVNWDELSNMYDGWSIAETGADRAGRKWPILCYGNGPRDNRPALMAWLCAIPSWFVGFTVAGCRGVAAVLGVAGVLLVGVWGRRVLGDRGALLTMLLLAVSPWHVLFSRSGHEGAALPGFFCVCIVLLMREAGERFRAGKAGYWRWVGAGLVTGFSANAYGATRLSALIFATIGAGLILCVGHRTGLRWPARARVLAMFVVAVGAGAAPQIYVFLVDPHTFLSRASALWFHAYDWLDAVGTFARNVAANLNPDDLFLSFGDEHELLVSRLSAAALPFLYIGFVSLVLPRAGWSPVDRVVLLLGVLACIAPAAVSRTSPHSLRASGCAVLLPMISGVGMVQAGRWALTLWELFRPDGLRAERKERRSRLAAALMGVVILGFGGSYVVRYLLRPDLQRAFHQPEWVALGKWLRDHAERYDRIYITPVGNSTNLGNTWDLYVAAFSGMRPREWQEAEREVWGRYTEFCTRLNQFYFRKRRDALEAWEESPQDECWLVTDVIRSYALELGCARD